MFNQKNSQKEFAIESDVLVSHEAKIGRTAIVGSLETEYIALTLQATYS